MATLSVGGTTVFDGATLQSGAVLTSATFPTGHVIQMKHKRHYVDGHHNLNSSSGWVSHGDEASFKFTFTPQQQTSTIVLDFTLPVTHTSTGGGYGYMAFTKDGSRTGWGVGNDAGVENYGHFYTGFSTYAGMYNSSFGRLVYQNSSISAFELGLDIKWAAGQWYYAHANGFCNLQATEFAGNCSA
jgi:hypothetical protein